MNRLACLFVMTTLALTGSASAQSFPNFSGTWTGRGGSLAIQQDAKALTVGEGTDTRVYTLDGSESRFVIGRNQAIARAHWAGTALVVEVTTISPIANWTSVEVYSMNDGQELSVIQVRPQMARTIVQTTMYPTLETYSRVGVTARK